MYPLLLVTPFFVFSQCVDDTRTRELGHGMCGTGTTIERKRGKRRDESWQNGMVKEKSTTPKTIEKFRRDSSSIPSLLSSPPLFRVSSPLSPSLLSPQLLSHALCDVIFSSGIQPGYGAQRCDQVCNRTLQTLAVRKGRTIPGFFLRKFPFLFSLLLRSCAHFLCTHSFFCIGSSASSGCWWSTNIQGKIPSLFCFFLVVAVLVSYLLLSVILVTDL